MNILENTENAEFRILCLDGGGSKGTYTIGFLQQLEALAGRPLYQCFDAIYGTSTGAIIAAMLGLGIPVPEIYSKYLTHVPKIMNHWFSRGKSKALKALATDIFEEKTFEAFKTFVAIVATNWDLETPLIFKSNMRAAYGSKATFHPGFGCTIADSVRASCAATPFFKTVELTTNNNEALIAADGGFFANNPTLLAVTDALGSFGQNQQNVKVLSVGCGQFPERKRNYVIETLKRIPTARLLQKVLSTNSKTIDYQCKFLFPHVRQIRVNNAYQTPELATDFLESNSKKLQKLYQRGRESFGPLENELSLFL